MDYKELYEQALERAKKFQDKELFAECNGNLVEYIFPELKESEDERIRKELINLVRDFDKNSSAFNVVSQESMFAWLEKQKLAWSEEDERTLSGIYQLIDFIPTSDTHFSKEQKDTCLAWLKSLKDRVQPQPKQEWSEEDEDIIEESISNWLHENNCDAFDKYGNVYVSMDNLKELVKSLRPQSHWKPSDEQIRVVARLRHCLLEDVKGNDVIILDNLLEQLKAL